MASIRRKTLIAIASILVISVVILLVFSQVIILNQFDSLQQNAIREHVRRVIHVIDEQLKTLGSTSNDWAYWDDTYQFVQDTNADYIELNLLDDTLRNLHLNFMVFVNTNGKTVFSKAYDLVNQVAVNLPKDLQPQTGKLHQFLNLPTETSLNIGIVRSSQGPVLVASRQILTSLITGPSQGVLIIGRYLNEAEIARIGEQTELAVEMFPIDFTNAPLDFNAVEDSLLRLDDGYVLYQRGEKMAEGYTLLKDVSGQPAFTLHIKTPNDIYTAGQRSLVYFLFAMVFSSSIIAIVISIWMERSVLTRIAFLDRRMSEIGNSDDLSARIELEGNDELGRLASTINQSLANREQSQEAKLKELNSALQRANAALHEKIDALKINQKYRDRFFTHASHEFRTPLAVMGTRLYLAKKQPDQYETHLQVLDEMHQRLLNVIDDVFDMTKLQENSLTLNMQKMELKSFIPMVLDEMISQLKEKGMSLRQEITMDDTTVKIDVVYFSRACDKLLNFMLEFSETGGETVVSLQRQTVSDMDIACLEISNTAFHFNPDELTNMFSPFYEVGDKKYHMTGLDLAIAKQIVEVHQGVLSARVDEVKGGCFSIVMPIASKPLTQTLVSRIEEANSGM